MKNLALLLAATLALGTTAAVAQTALPEIADADGSGAWSLTELQAVLTDMTEDTFKAADTNADGSVDAAELTAAVDGGIVMLPKQ